MLQKDKNHSDSIALTESLLIAVWRLLGDGLALSVCFPGCGSQRLLRCRSHPAGRGPNSSSLFPPLAAVVAVAPKGGATGVSVRPTRDEQSSLYPKTAVPCCRGQQLRDNIPCQAAVNLCSRALYFMRY